jgi:pyruvate/2-oxoglutarate dehydrogenase complex dihydrolipoamide acyltransferase (E2) component
VFFVYSTEVGDFVQQDDEVATIETDKIDVTVNSPASGTIVEVFAQEEDNVSVGADFFRLELGDAPKEGSWELYHSLYHFLYIYSMIINKNIRFRPCCQEGRTQRTTS